MNDQAAGAAAEMEEGRASTGEVGIPPPGYRLPASVRLGPVRLQVADLARSEAFYERVLGLVRRGASSDGSGDGRSEGSANGLTGEDGDGRGSLLLGVSGKEDPLVELVEEPGAAPVPPGGRLGLYHFALRVPDRAALGRVARRLQNLGVRVGMADHRVSEALYLTDPDGLGIEVYRDRPRSEWRREGRQIVMTTDPLDLEGLLEEGSGDPSGGVPAGTDMGHVHLHVGDLQEAARFYHEALGFDKMVWSYPGALFLSAGGYHHRLGVNTWAAPARPAGPDDARLLRWTLVLADPGEVQRLAESVREASYPVQGSETEGGAIRLRDPWGTEVVVG